MTQPLTVVILSTGLENFKELRNALSADSRVQLLAGGDDADQLHDEITRLKPMAAIISLGTESEQGIRFIKRLNSEFPKIAIISAAHNASQRSPAAKLASRCARVLAIAGRATGTGNSH